MVIRNVVVVGLCAVMLIACGGDESAAKKAVLESLKDPDSAKFGEFHKVGDEGACFAVNAKNSMGGYTGTKFMIMAKIDGKWEAVTSSDSLAICTQVLAEMAKRNKK